MNKYSFQSIHKYFLIVSISCSLLQYVNSNHQINDLQQYENMIAHCEYSALRLGSRIADLFNAPIGQEDWNERIHQDSIIEHLGFAPWLQNGISASNGKTLQGSNAKKIYYKKGNWGNKNISSTPYGILNHKWIYMFGDSTTRQIWASFAAPFQNENFERNAKEWTRHYCNSQPYRKHHEKNGNFDKEGWRGPCGVNEITCHVSGYGDNGVLSFDWKHFPYEDYDNYFWGENGPWRKGFSGEGNRRPDVLTIQFGMHSCWHANPQGLYSKHLAEVNHTMIDAHMKSIPKLMQQIRYAVDNPPNIKGKLPADKTIVIILTSGSTGMQETGNSIDECILRFNRITVDTAHEYGFAVLERGEIERRLMHKSFYTKKPFLLSDMHLPQPAQNLISTSLLHLITCLYNKTAIYQYNNISELLITRRKHIHQTPPALPLHSPPSV